ncbi:UvrD-helicase domain-containing protein [Shewanella sp. TB7-MNA-CIBAN-0143]|uniref:UvrD-helicase domain-containing protein n=1 Tax=Shewanella sp. TB7-MNA-CIBAN-0143 TaxID=3140465 RepID=UPI00332FD2D4
MTTILTQGALLGAILSPNKVLDSKPKGNYQQAVKSAREILKPIIEKQQLDCDSVEKIIRSKKSAIYVEGCPGAGKTRLIVDRVRHLLAQGVNPSSICVLAFTKIAAHEFTYRLKEQKLYSDGMIVSTFSGWCNTLLNEENMLPALIDEQARNAIQSCIKKYNKSAERDNKSITVKRCIALFNHMANFNNPDIILSIKKIDPYLVDYTSDIEAIFKIYDEYKKGKYRDYNDMLVQMREGLSKPDFLEKTTSRYEHMIIDEIQDTNLVQWDIIKTMYIHKVKLFCVGDPAQSIFGFRGADSQYLAKFGQLFKGSKFQLTRNYRTTKSLVKLSNALRFQINKTFIGSVSVSKDNEVSDELAQVKYCDELNDAVAWLIKNIKNSSELYAQQLILCRYNEQIEIIKTAMIDAGYEVSKKYVIQVSENYSIPILTYHSSKSLEAENCYVFDPLFSKKKLSTYKEELRNTYVAFTRSKIALTILVCATGSKIYELDEKTSKRQSKSIFLNLPDEFTQVIES